MSSGLDWERFGVITGGRRSLHFTTPPFCLKKGWVYPLCPFPIFLSRCKFSTLTTRQPMVEFYLLTFPRFPLRKKEHKSYFGKNRTHDFRTSRCAAYLLEDHSGEKDFPIRKKNYLVLRKAIYFFLIEKSRSKNAVFRFRSAFSISHKIGPDVERRVFDGCEERRLLLPLWQSTDSIL